MQTGLPCDPNGQFLEPDTPPPPREEPANNDWTPFNGPAEFMMADLLYRKVSDSDLLYAAINGVQRLRCLPPIRTHYTRFLVC